MFNIKGFLLSVFLIIAPTLYAKVNTVVSIVPQKSFVEAIGGDLVDVSIMVQPGSSPHSYEPKPSQMKELSNAHIYFAIGVEFESAWLKRFQNQNKSLKIVDTSKGITKLDMVAHHHDDEKDHGHKHHNHKHNHKHDTKSKDPHIWTSPANIKVIAQNIYNELVSVDSANKDIYEANLKAFLEKVDSVDSQIKEILKDTPKGAKFMVFHPALGYFAHDYNLTQIAVEVEGKEPKPAVLAKLINEAKEEGIKAIFTQPEFSDKSAKVVADELGIKVIKVSPLNPKWDENLINLAKAISNQ
ncbi:metal ABC transporter solute-binding protein, Zn/Mn family [Arcobacter sp. FWKO B]|uniref:metal ABC transporter solute-binding protein, Zn/Mn family n=1 Tax=Arcobacter sp. FWKO B TaxID=2593672 RepID=UPI0018A4D77C|nr:zinc ABC transporter substrate-binding protein [Arcobacter sp. FWKO B]QOG11830.1 zinc ABC transporter substrate-binding protein [Arcobacter sp. FWKO B]